MNIRAVGRVGRLLAILALVLSVVGCRKDAPEAATLRIWQTEVDPGAVAVLRDVAQQFERAHPGVKVEIQSIAWGALSSNLVTALAAGAPPDIAHVQPFMVASLQSKGQLEPLDDLIDSLNPNDIYPAVRDLQLLEGHRYGIAYAIGATYFGYRKDLLGVPADSLPATWQAFLSTVSQSRPDSGTARILLPGGDPFFMDQLTVELLSSNGGRLFNEQNRPLLTDRRFIEVLQFYRELARLAPPDWLNEKYVDQFRHFATGRGVTVPVTYARAALQIDKDAPDEMNDPNHFAVMPQPVGPSGTQSYATLDAEPWVVFRASRHTELAKEFLRLFYRRDNYIRFCRTVPMHLTPIFRSMAESDEYLSDPFIRKWAPWQDQLLASLRSGRVKPIFVSEDADLRRPFLLEFQGSRILSELVFAVAKDDEDPIQAAAAAQTRAEALIERLGHRRW
jgi:multiple sugar transport system substrate-binding protein